MPIRFVDMEWVRENIGRVLILDARPYVKYMAQGHIPTAINAPVSRVMDVSTGALKPLEVINEALSKWGVVEGEAVVVYDEYDGQLGSRLAWTLEYCGLEEVLVMRQFFDSWLKANYPVSFKLEKPQRNGDFRCRPNEELRATPEYIMASLERALLLDVRSPQEYHGVAGEFPRHGHIPKAENLPWLTFVDQGGYRLVDPGLGREREVIVYCDYGLRASVAYVVLRHLGYRVKLYERGYAEWSSRRELPVER